MFSARKGIAQGADGGEGSSVTVTCRRARLSLSLPLQYRTAALAFLPQPFPALRGAFYVSLPLRGSILRPRSAELPLPPQLPGLRLLAEPLQQGPSPLLLRLVVRILLLLSDVPETADKQPVTHSRHAWPQPRAAPPTC